ncbi:peptide/nickel transport system ATP-binding protein [Aquamicrobium lusatiense]|uniref:Peptide/nickel transport system ATP-binding protein n=1 Tax=Aquamicrobium lusatiense TaxID=89772 RepID=A0A7W9VWA3_9HYPH|nr:ABC transporter ATP-binding protein [Aquamicrobium lusatiense]MBB6014719.1 peptide/nickel transport system ATP-binding protein [Aquamicrobium lusatiense]
MKHSPLSETTLSIRDLDIGLANGMPLVRKVSFDIAPGQVMALVGESGSGKTLIGRAILRLLPEGIRQTAGEIRYHGKDLSEAGTQDMSRLRGARIGMVFQEPLVSLNPALRIGEQMAEGLRLHHKLSAAEIRERSIAMLRRIHIADPEGCLTSYPHQFSGGMRQRIMLASVMLLRPDLLIADEPTTALDTLSEREVLETMIELTREVGTSILLVTHNLGLVARYADETVVLRQGEVVERGHSAAILASPEQDYTRQLVEALPRAPAVARTSPAGKAILEARDLKLSFASGSGFGLRSHRKPVLRGVSLAIRKGETVAVVGASGSGKTTLGRAMLRLIDTDSGQLLYHGQDIARAPDRRLRDFRRSCQIVFQDPFSSLDPRMRVKALVGEPLRHDASLSAQEKASRVRSTLADVGLPGYEERLPHELSGGQRQRVAIARAIVSQPDLIVADEPISALDMTVQKQVLELFERLQSERGFACVFISHDLAAVRQIAHRIVVMDRGEIAEEGDCHDVFENPRHEYTRRLIAASPAIDAATMATREQPDREVRI